VLDSYRKAEEVCWVQEEPQNMGAWNYLRHRILQTLTFGRKLRCISRPESPSPSAGSRRGYQAGQAAILNAAFEQARSGTEAKTRGSL